MWNISYLVNFGNYNEAWSILIQIVIIFGAVLLGNLIRTKVSFIRKALIPSALIGGLIVLLLKFIPGVKTFINNDFMQLVTYHCIGLSFASMSLKTIKRKKTSTIKVVENGFMQGAVYIGQAALGLGITILMFIFTKDSSNPIFYGSGALLSLGFAQGPGNALSWDNIYSTEHPDLFTGNGSFGLTIATIGFIVASVVGITFMNIMRHKGKLKIRELPKGDLRKVSDYEGENEIPATESVDKLSIQIGLVLLAYAGAFGIMFGLSKASEFTAKFAWGFNFLWATLSAYLLKLILKGCKKAKLIKREYTNNYLLDRFSGVMFDAMVVAGVCAIQFDDVKRYILPIIILSIAGTIATFLFLYFTTRHCFKGYENEAFLANFGTLTGQLSNGMILLREVDPTYVTPASDNLILLQFPLLILLLPEMMLLDFNGTTFEHCIITFAIWTGTFIAYTLFLYRRKIFKKMYKNKPEEVFVEEEK